METDSNAGLSRSISTLVCLANNHPKADEDYNIPFCVATLDRLDQNEETTYQLIGFNNTCQRPEYKLQGYLTPKYVSSFATAYWPKIGNGQFRDIELIPCSELGIEEEFTKFKDLSTVGLAMLGVSAFQFFIKTVKAAKFTFYAAIVLTGGLLLLELAVERYINKKRRERINNLLSGN